MIRFLVTGMICALILHIFAVQSSAEYVTLQWDTNDDANYYIVYYGTSSGNYTNESNTIYAPTTQITLDVTAGYTWYFSVKAFNESGNSSDYSDEISYIASSTTTDPDPLEAAIESPALNASIYQGESINFLGNYTGGVTPYSYTWDFGDSGISSQTVEDPGEVYFYTVGTFDITFSVTDGSGTTSSDTVQVTVQEQDIVPTATIISPASAVEITAGGSVTFAGSSSGGNGTLTHAWDFGNSGLAAKTVEDPGAVVFSKVGVYTVTYTVTDSDGDSASDSVEITVESGDVNLIPTATIVSPDDTVDMIAGDSVTFAGSSSGGNGTLTHAWDFGDSTLSVRTVEDPGAVVFSQVGSFTVTYTVTDSDGDYASDSVTINVYEAPSATIISPASAVTITEGESVTFAASYTGGIAPVSHSWVFGNGGPAAQTVEDPGAVSFPDAGTYTVIYTVTDSHQEYDSDLVMVTVEAAPADDTGTGDDSGTGDTADDSTTDGTGTGDDSGTDDTGTDDDSSTVSLKPVLVADVEDAVTEMQWQISPDADFRDVVLNVKVKNSTTLTVPEMVLNSGVEYYWRYRNKTPKAADSKWSDAQSFVTEATEWNDNNGNGIPDAQEAPDGLDLNMDGVADEIQPDAIRCVKSTLGDSVIGLMKTDGVVDIELLESIDYTTILDTTNMPESMPSGMIGFRVVVDTVGATVHMGICFSEAIPEDAVWYKYDSVNGWQDYTENTVISDDRMMITVTLTDGGPGDSDGIANGVIVDPSGIGLNYSTGSSSPLGVNASEESCFIGSSSNGQATCWVCLLVPMLAVILLGVTGKAGHTVTE